MMDEREIRLRCIEAAAKAPIIHNEGPATGVLEVAGKWAEWVIGPKPDQGKRETIGLPGKK